VSRKQVRALAEQVVVELGLRQRHDELAARGNQFRVPTSSRAPRPVQLNAAVAGWLATSSSGAPVGTGVIWKYTR
jgi:hypothetical protein